MSSWFQKLPRWSRWGLPAAGLLGVLALLSWWRWQPTPTIPPPYRAIAHWLEQEALPGEVIAVAPEAASFFPDYPTLLLPVASVAVEPAPAIILLNQARPAYCLLSTGLPWQGLERAPWFQAHYHEVYRVSGPASSLLLFRYRVAPLDEGTTISTTVRFALGPDAALRLIGYRVASHRLTPGAPFYLTFYWQAETLVYEPLLLVVRLVEPTTGQVIQRVENATPGGLGTAFWNGGAVLTDPYTLNPPLTLPAGEYRVTVEFYRANGSPVLPERDFAVPLLVPPAVSRVPPTPDQPLDIQAGPAIALLGYDVMGLSTPGETLRVALYWHAIAPSTGDYKVFVHLLAADGHVAAQDDSQPVAWTYPTTRWQPGEYIRDEHVLLLQVPRGDYRLAVGLYDPGTGERLPLRDAGGNELPERRLILTTLQVR